MYEDQRQELGKYCIHGALCIKSFIFFYQFQYLITFLCIRFVGEKITYCMRETNLLGQRSSSVLHVFGLDLYPRCKITKYRK